MKNTFFISWLCFFYCCNSQPPSFTVQVSRDSAPMGYYFLSSATCLMILDKTGGLVYYKPGKQLSNFMLQPNGLMTYYAPNKFYFMDSAFRVTDSIACKTATITNYRDLRVLPNGHFLLMGSDTAGADLSRFPLLEKKTGRSRVAVEYAIVEEQDALKNVVFEWSAKDHYAMDDIDTFFLSSALVFDWTHADAIEMDYDGNILLSIRNFNEITKINRSNGSIMWRLGGKNNEFKFSNLPTDRMGHASLFFGQHDIRRIANGHITLFDGGDHAVPHGARAMEFDLDETKKTAKLEWSYTLDSTMYSVRQGNVQRLYYSNTLINFGNTAGNPDNMVSFVVINAAGEKTFQLSGIRSYRVFNYSTLPWQLNRPQIVCRDSSGFRYLDAGIAAKSYHWNTGDSTRIIRVTQTGSYSVFVPDSEGGYLSSEMIVVTDISKPCDTLPRIDREKLYDTKKKANIH